MADTAAPATDARMSAAPDPYAALALVYDDWQARYGSFSEAVLPRILPLLDAERPIVQSFAEAGCGTGTLLLELAAQRPGWRLAGADASRAMLACARAKPSAGRVAWYELALGAPIPGAPYDAAGCFFNTLNHLRDGAQLCRALAGLGAALRAGGLLMFDVNEAAGYARWWNGRHVYRGPGWSMSSVARFDAARGQAEATIAVQRGSRAAKVVVRERLFSHAQIADALRAAGFGEISSQPWSPTPDGATGSSFWTARRRGEPPGCRQALDHSNTCSEGGPPTRVTSRPNASTR